jgi:hypothetical protein
MKRTVLPVAYGVVLLVVVAGCAGVSGSSPSAAPQATNPSPGVIAPSEHGNVEAPANTRGR